MRAAQDEAATARDRLMVALGAVGIPHDANADFEVLLAVAQTAIDRQAKLKALHDAVEERRSALRKRHRDIEKAVANERTWNATWDKACSACWLREGGSAPPLGTVREVLAAVAGLGPALEKQASLADRIRKMERDQAAFAAEVEALALELNVSTSGSVPDLVQAINEQVRGAHAAQATRTDKEKSLASAHERKRKLAETLAIHSKRKAEMTGFFGVSTFAEVGLQLQSIEKQAELLEQADLAISEILEAVRLPTIDEAEQALDTANRLSLETEFVELKARFDDADQRSRELFSAQSKAIDQIEAIGGDDAVAKIEGQRRTTLLEIEEKAARYLRLRLGSAAAEQALRVYRDRHRSSMMARASEAFSAISRGAYKGLGTQPEKASETLIAVGSDGGSKIASELSKGTRFQLYLALRVAGYHEFVRARGPVPFIADDIMETFDDFRAEEAFRLLSDMSQMGQVLYLTHHRHLCEIAQTVCPAAKLYKLAS